MERIGDIEYFQIIRKFLNKYKLKCITGIKWKLTNLENNQWCLEFAELILEFSLDYKNLSWV